MRSMNATFVLCNILILTLDSGFRYTGNQFFQDYYWRIYPYVVPFVYPVALMAQTGSAYLTLAVTIERYLVGHLRLTFAVSFTWIAMFKTSKPHF